MSNKQKFFKQSLTSFLSLGAILLLGLLSFAGMYVLYPILSVCIAAFILSVVYEGEIYQKNISHAFDKLLDKNFTAQTLGKEYLKNFNFRQTNVPTFFQTYQKIKSLKSSAAQKQRLKTMEIWLGQLLCGQSHDSDYAKTVIQWIQQDIANYQTQSQKIQSYHYYIKVFSLVAASFMALGTIFLMLEVLPVLPFLTIAPTILPYVVIPMSSIAGIAYGFLTYNSLTDFLLKNDFNTWWQDIKKNAYQRENLAFVGFSVFIFALNLILTLCTAGTWWTVVNSTQATWSWLKHPLTKIATALIAPVIAFSTLGFNLPNTLETINEVKEALEEHQNEKGNHHHPKKSQETLMQRFNPFRILIKLTFTPLLILFFLGHLISIGLTADRMPGMPSIVSALLGMLSEGFEDFHYFFDLESMLKPLVIGWKIITSPFQALLYLIKSGLLTLFNPQEAPNGAQMRTELWTIFSIGFIEAFSSAEISEHDHHHEHDHDHHHEHDHDHHHEHEHHHEHSDLPNQILKFCFSPLFLFSALWHWYFQNENTLKSKSFKKCLYLQLGWSIETKTNQTTVLDTVSDSDWLRTESVFALNEKITELEQAWFNKDLAQKKVVSLKNIREEIQNTSKKPQEITQIVTIENVCKKENQHLKKPRFFTDNSKTSSEMVVDQVLKNELAIFNSRIIDEAKKYKSNRKKPFDILARNSY